MAKIYEFSNDKIPFYATDEYVDAFIEDCFECCWEEEEEDRIYREYYNNLEFELIQEQEYEASKIKNRIARFLNKLFNRLPSIIY